MKFNVSEESKKLIPFELEIGGKVYKTPEVINTEYVAGLSAINDVMLDESKIKEMGSDIIKQRNKMLKFAFDGITDKEIDLMDYRLIKSIADALVNHAYGVLEEKKK